MDNPSEILETLDKHLDHEVRLVLYGRGGLHLGFENSPTAWANTQDVDGIIEATLWEELSEDKQFWESIEATNEELSDKGLYITHLFGEEQVFLRRDWTEHLVPVLRPPTKYLNLFRPATIDLVLTKMMRGDDPQDMEDAAFLIRHDRISTEQLEAAFACANLTDIVELHGAFDRAKPLVLEMASSNTL
ncbi:MAG: hypothetical protein P1U86_03515 [Verrucomicrobiales bacterium]|nr:hypothetical protein [Verrucomicrobiales bacterium]